MMNVESMRQFARSEVLTAVLLNVQVFWNVSPCLREQITARRNIISQTNGIFMCYFNNTSSSKTLGLFYISKYVSKTRGKLHWKLFKCISRLNTASGGKNAKQDACLFWKRGKKVFKEEMLTHSGAVINEDLPKFALRYKSRGQLEKLRLFKTWLCLRIRA